MTESNMESKYPVRDEDEAIGQSNITPGDGLRRAKPQAQKQYEEGPHENDWLM